METPDEKQPIIEVNNLTIAYKTRYAMVEAVKEATFSVRRGETLGIVGESGCGKSTIAFGLVGYLGSTGRVQNGSILFEGSEMVGRSEAELQEIRGNRISVVYQDPMQALNPSLRIGKQLVQVLRYHDKSLSEATAREKVVYMLERVYMPDPGNVINRYPHQISGGQSQRVVIAMALLNNPSLLIMDEPTTALDVTVEATVLDLVNDLKNDFNAGIIFITHNLGVVARVADSMCVMYAGEIVEQGPTRAIFKQPIHPYTNGLLRCIPMLGDNKGDTSLYNIRGRVPQPAERAHETCLFFPRCDCSKDTCDKQRPDLIALDSEHSARCFHANAFAANPIIQNSSEPLASGDLLSIREKPKRILTQENLKVYYQHDSGSVADWFGLGKKQYIKAVDGVSLNLDSARTLGVVGESGCGKSSMVKALIGLEAITDGQVEFLGVDIGKPAEKRGFESIRELQMVFQNPDSTLNPCYSVGRQIARSVALFKTVPRNKVKLEALRLLKAVRLTEAHYERLPNQLSGGEKQRVSIARALASRPDLIICDEPVSALDVSVQAAVLNLLLDIQQSSQTALIFIAHDLSVVRYFSDDVAVMYLGKIVETGPADSIYKPPFHPYTEALLSAIPIPDPDIKQSHQRLSGNVPSPLNPPRGCRFHTRCLRREIVPGDKRICEREEPMWQDAGQGHMINCHIPLETLVKIQEEK
jgi:peptide/nickel transport system ATP-binding protein